MQKKKVIGAGIGIVVVIAVILGGVMLHKDNEAVETMAETTLPPVEEASDTATEEPETAEAEPQTVETTDSEETAENMAGTEQETDILQEDEIETETAEEEETEEEVIDDLDTIMYATQNVNLRQGTAVTTESLRLVGFAEEVKVTGITTNKQWYRVEDTEKGEGFIASSYLSDTKPEQNTSAQQTASNSSESTQSSGGGSTDTQSGGGSSSIPGVSQSELDQLKADLAGLQSGYVQTHEDAMEGAGGEFHLNQ